MLAIDWSTGRKCRFHLANIEEGYGPQTSREYNLFLYYARGSTQETQGRYDRMSHWLSPEIIQGEFSSAKKSSLSLPRPSQEKSGRGRREEGKGQSENGG